MFFSQSLFSKFEKKCSCCHFGFVHQSVRDETEIAGRRVREREKKTADRNISQIAEAQLVSVSVHGFRNSRFA